MPWKMSYAAMLPFITGSVPALQSAMTHRTTTASVSIEVSLKRRIPFQSASWPKNPNSCKSGKIQKNNPVLCLLLILSLYSIQNYYPLQTRTLQGFESSCPLLKKDFGKNYCPCPLLKKQLPQKCPSCLLFLTTTHEPEKAGKLELEKLLFPVYIRPVLPNLHEIPCFRLLKTGVLWQSEAPCRSFRQGASACQKTTQPLLFLL